MVLLDATFEGAARIAIQRELVELQTDGRITLGRDNRWRPRSRNSAARKAHSQPVDPEHPSSDREKLISVPAMFGTSATAGTDPAEGETDGPPDPAALLRYYRSALQSDPRGAITQSDDRHGQTFQFLSGHGLLFPPEEEAAFVRVRLEDMPGPLREALIRRDGEENGIALGWPVAVGRDKGAPVVRPVGLIAGLWNRTDDYLEIRIETDDVLANPDWVKAAARRSAWTLQTLEDLFRGPGSSGLPGAEFLARLREAAAPSIRGQLTGHNFASVVDPAIEGIVDAVALFLPSGSTFTAGAVGDLDLIASWPIDSLSRTALSALIGVPNTEVPRTVPAINIGPLNLEQVEAVQLAMSEPLSVVTGPPGTGKSQAIVAMAATALWNSQSVVVASRNHQALDAVEQRLGGIAPDVSFIVRTLDPARDEDRSMTKVLADLVSGHDSGTVSEQEPAVTSELDRRATERESAITAIRGKRKLHLQLADDIERLEARIAAKLSDLPTGSPNTEPTGIWHRILTWLGLTKRQATNDGDGTDRPVPTFELKRRIKSARADLANMAPDADPIALSKEIEVLARTLLGRHVAAACAIDESTRLFLRNAKADLDIEGTGKLPRDIAEQILSYRPIWLASVLGAPRRIPLEEGLFDLVIFDEASQCDIASALPLLARARRAVIVGDDRQLTFIPQLGISQDRNLMAAQRLPLKGVGRFAQGSKSLFDLARSTTNVPATMLRDQYRSASDIVAYINRDFYGGRLRVSADQRSLRVPTKMRPGLTWTDVRPSGALPGRNENSAEVEAIVSHMKVLLIDQKYDGTIGVIAPFRPQVLALEIAIADHIPEEQRKAADLRVSTIDGFQGQERDLILFSTVVHAGANASAVTFLQRDWRRLNVAISRARAVAHIFGDLSYARSGAVRRLQSLAAFATEPRTTTQAEGVFDSNWERRVYEALRARGLAPEPQYEIAGRRLDFALFGQGGVKLDLEVDGRRWHQDVDGNRKLDDIWRDHQLKSLGWQVRRFWVDELDSNMEGCLEQIERDLA